MIAPQFSLKNLNGWKAGWKTPDRRPIYEWCADNLRVHYAPRGTFDIQSFRYQIAPFEAIQNELVREVHICGAIQTGKSQIIDLAVPWIMVNDPGPMMWTFQAEDDGKEHLLTRCWPMWDSCAALKGLWPMDRHRKNTMEVFFGSFFFIANGANPNSLQSKTIRWKINSELWLPAWQDVYKQAVGRVSAYVRTAQSKIINDSQSGNKDDVMDKVYKSGSQSVWSAPCPACKKIYPLRITQPKLSDGTRWGMVWADDCKTDDGKLNVNRCVETVHWRCACGHEMPDTAATRNYWNDTGLYVDENPGAPSEVKSFWWGSVHVHPMRELAKEKASAMNVMSMGDSADLKTFRQQRENVPWEETHLMVNISTHLTGYKYADFAHGELWEGEIYRCMTMDRQHGIGGDSPHRWAEIRAYKASGASRQLYYGRVGTKEAARELQRLYGVKDRSVWQDAAFEKHEVLKECVEFGWIAIFGSDQKTWTHYSRRGGEVEPTKVTLPFSPMQISEVGGPAARAYYLHFNAEYCSDVLSNLIAGNGVPWEHPDDWSAEHQEQLKNKQKIEKRPGVYKWETVKSRPDHGHDTSKMQVAFALVMKLLSTASLKEEKAA